MSESPHGNDGGWALVLGASSGFGAAASRALARAGLNIVGVHLDRRSTLQNAKDLVAEIETTGRRAIFHNLNAADEEKRGRVVQELHELMGEGEKLRVLLHSLAFGTLKPLVGPQAVTPSQMNMTLDVMAHSLVYWTQALDALERLGEGSRIFAMTSAGSFTCWDGYGPVSAAKAALEAHCRQLAFELGPKKVSVNALMAGVTDTPALRKIPGHEAMLERAADRHPAGRLTRPEDVAETLVTLALGPTAWLTGNVIRLDGGETLAG